MIKKILKMFFVTLMLFVLGLSILNVTSFETEAVIVNMTYVHWLNNCYLPKSNCVIIHKI